MPDFKVTAPDGASYKITAPDENAAMQAFNDMMGASKAAAPQNDAPPKPVDNWNDLATALDARQAGMSDFRQPPEAAISQARIDEAKRQGLLHGLSQPAGSTFGRSFANDVALGLPDLLEAATSGFGTGLSTAENHEFIKAADQGRAQANPWSAAGGGLTAALAQGMILPGLSAATRTGRVAQGAAQGAALSGAQGLVESRGDVKAAAKDAAIGAVGGAAGSYIADRVGGAIGNMLDRRAVLQQAPTAEQLRAEAGQLYQQADNLGIHYAQPAVDNMAQDLGHALVQEGIDRDVTPRSWAAFRRIWQDTANDLPLQRIELLRRVAQNAAQAPDPNERRLGGIIINHLDDFVANAGPHDVIAGTGDPAAAADILGRARDLWAALRRGGNIGEAINNAEITAAATHSGQNANNAIRQKFAAILKNQAQRRGYTPEQLQAMRAVVDGTPIGNVARNIGKLVSSQGLGGLMSAGAGAGFGAAMAGPVGGAIGGFALPAIGAVARRIGDASTRNAANYAEALARIPAQQRQAMLAALQARGRRPSLQQLHLISALSGQQLAPSITSMLAGMFSDASSAVQ